MKRDATKTSALRWVHAGLSLWLLLSVLTGVELAFALFVDFSDAFNMTNISKRWLARHIDAERNDEGFRDLGEFTKHVPEGVHRICFVGDSFTIGHASRIWPTGSATESVPRFAKCIPASTWWPI